MFIQEERNEGVVIKREGKNIWISLNTKCDSRKSSCSSGCSNCASGVAAKKTMLITDSADKYSPGQFVSFRQYSISETFTALILFGVPILFSAAAIAVWYSRSPETIESPVSILTTVAAFVFGFIPVWLIDKLFQKKYPPILQSHPSNETEESSNG